MCFNGLFGLIQEKFDIYKMQNSSGKSQEKIAERLIDSPF
jgi:hypothetical protein